MNRQPLRRLALAVAAAALPACSGATAMTPMPDLAPDTAVHLSMSYALAAGQEQHLCQLMQLPTSDSGELLVSGESHSWTLAHHWNLMRSNVTSVPSGFTLNTPVDCFSSGISAYAGSSLFIDQVAQSSYDFPDGTALPFKSGELVIVEVHALNATQTDATGQLTVTLSTTTADKVQNRLGLIQFYDPFIYVPPMSSASANMRCKIPSDITLITAMTHFHPRGVDEKVFVDLHGQPAATAPLVESTDWQHPNQWKGTMALPAGSSVHFGCSYQNNDQQPYIQGQDKVGNEMCMTIGFYYPALDTAFEGCFADGEASEMGTGTATCGQTTSCIQSCPPGEAPTPNGLVAINVGPCFQKCVVDSCPSASVPFQAQAACIRAHCASDCAAGGSSCAGCVLQNCANEYAACQNHTCP
jgi:hypothetical protein